MPRIPPALLASIKRDVSCVAVLEARGQVFEKHGADVVTRCPFHEDRTPSLIVSESKNLWRCHGACGIGGDVIALAQKLHGVSFRHAVELLAAGLPSGAAGSTFAAGSKPLARMTSRALLPCPLDAGADEARLFQQVVDFYAQRLHEPGNAGRAYLASRGLDDTELLRRFAFGYADRTLGLRLPNKQRKEGQELRTRLETLGLFRASGHEHFSGSVVVPIPGDDGALVGMYGRKVIQNLRTGTPLHTYLPGKHRGIWNSGPGLVDGNGAVVVCEALLDAASYWVAGVRHVTAAYGVNGWTDDHWRALGEVKARDVFVAFDADAAGDAAGDTLADLLIGRGYTAYRVTFPPGLDANDLLTTPAGGRDALRATLATAQWLGGASRVSMPAMLAAADAPVAAGSAAAVPPSPAIPPGVVVSQDGGDLFATLGTRIYRVRGWGGSRNGDTLTVAVRLVVTTADGDRLHHDRLDLYQTRQRTAFVAAAAGETGLHADVIKADLGALILVVEAAEVSATRAATAAASAPIDPAATMTPEERAAALAWLQAPDLAGRIIADLTRCGLIGEDVNKLVGYIAATSRKLDSPLAVVVQSSSAAGKSTLVDRVLSLMPPEDVRQYSAMSGKSPFYLGTANLKHRILAIAEEEGARRASYALKLLQSDGFLTMAATGKNPHSGKLEAHEYRVEGPVMLLLTTTAIDLDPELLNRCVVLTVDEEPAQTAAIQASQRDGRTLTGMAAKRERTAIAAMHRNAQRLLRPLTVVNPHAPLLTFAAHQTRLRRDHAKYLALIDAVTFLHQHQRAVKRHEFPDGTLLEYIEVTPADIALAHRLAAVVLARGLDDLPPQTRRFLGQVHAWVTAAATAAGTTLERFAFTRRQAREALDLGQTQARLHLDRLCDYELVTTLRPVGDGLTQRYRLAWPAAGGPTGTAGLSLGPVPDGTDAATPTTSTCRGVVGGLSAPTPTGQSSGKNRTECTESATCRLSGVRTEGHIPPAVMSCPQAEPLPEAS